MITFPENLTETYLPGYYWDVKDKALYSIKVNGILTKMKVHLRSRFMAKCGAWYYRVSHKGKSKYFSERYLSSLELKDSQLPKKVWLKESKRYVITKKA